MARVSPTRFQRLLLFLSNIGIDVEVHAVAFDADLIEDLKKVENTYQPRLFIILGPCLVAEVARFRCLTTPLLFVESDDAPTEYPKVMSDDIDGTRTLVNSMLDAGHQRIAVLTDDGVDGEPNYAKRIIGYRQAIEARGIKFDPSIIHSLPIDSKDYLSSSEEMLMKYILPVLQYKAPRTRAKPTAVLVLSDFLALTLMRVLWNAGITVPHDLSVASYGGWTLTKFIPTSIHTWVQPVPDLLATVMEAMRAMLANKPFPKTLDLPQTHPDGSHGIAHAITPRTYIVPGYLREGQSLAPPSSTNDSIGRRERHSG